MGTTRCAPDRTTSTWPHPAQHPSPRADQAKRLVQRPGVKRAVCDRGAPRWAGPLDLVQVEGLGDSRSAVAHQMLDFVGPDAGGAENVRASGPRRLRLPGRRCGTGVRRRRSLLGQMMYRRIMLGLLLVRRDEALLAAAFGDEPLSPVGMLRTTSHSRPRSRPGPLRPMRTCASALPPRTPVCLQSPGPQASCRLPSGRDPDRRTGRRRAHARRPAAP